MVLVSRQKPQSTLNRDNKMELKVQAAGAEGQGGDLTTGSTPGPGSSSSSSTSISTSSSTENTIVVSVAEVTKENRRYDTTNRHHHDNRRSDYGDRDSQQQQPRRNHPDRDRGYTKKSYHRFNQPHQGYYGNGNGGYHGYGGGNGGYGNRGYKRGYYNNDYYTPAHHHSNYHQNYNNFNPNYAVPYYNNTPRTNPGSVKAPATATANSITDSTPTSLSTSESESNTSIQTTSTELEHEVEVKMQALSPNPSEDLGTEQFDDTLNSMNSNAEDSERSLDTSGTVESSEKYNPTSPSPSVTAESDCSTIPPPASPAISSPERDEINKSSSSITHQSHPKNRTGSNSRPQTGENQMNGNGLLGTTVGWGIESLDNQCMYFNTTKGYYTYPPSSASTYTNDNNRQGYPYTNYQPRSYYPTNRRDNLNSFELYNTGAGFYPNYFPHDPHHFGNTLYTPAGIPATQFMFQQPPEIGLSEIIKNANSLSLATPIEKWGYPQDDEKQQFGENTNCGSRSISPSNSISNATTTSGHNYNNPKKRTGNGTLNYSNAHGSRRGHNRNGIYYESRFHPTHFHIEEMIKGHKYVEIEDMPDQFVAPGTPNQDQLEKLSKQIWIKFQKNQQTPEIFRKKLELWRELSEDFRQIDPMYQLEIVGSTISGFGSNSSDIDICLLLSIRNEVDPRAEAIDILENLSPRIDLIPNLEKTDLILAKVPILKLKEKTREIDIDINVNNSVGLRNTQLLYAYAQADWRVRPLVLVTKLWASFHGINDAKCMTLSSYSLSLMVIHYLQCGVSPAVLPNLQQLFPERFSNYIETSKVRRTMLDPVLGVPPTTNKMSLAELLIGFLQYYAVKFDYKTNAISVRNGCTLPIKQCAYRQAPKNDSYQWKFMNIEGDLAELTTENYPFKILEPFEFTNTARSVYDKDVFDRIRGIFVTSWTRLEYTHNLDSIFTPTSPLEARLIGSRVRGTCTTPVEFPGIFPAQ